ncbi:unnamed protein product [Miscanthus lutarioriparius]|uniref:Uncharacterized protein n=1 Tax=Miscanthus lutarioriparius TaxID=422564 RepID=A0A811Q0K6_9POAL|nr:unnamed protein product [Miscanthus lutarioriparius]
MAHHVKKGTALLPIAALVVAMAMFLSSCDAADTLLINNNVKHLYVCLGDHTDYCHAIVPCSDETCFYYCQKNNYKNFQTYCTPGQYYPNCCCRVPDA